jgi:hypothetical protein
MAVRFRRFGMERETVVLLRAGLYAIVVFALWPADALAQSAVSMLRSEGRE